LQRFNFGTINRNHSMSERIIILGAGPTGLGAAYRLQEKGFTNFCLYERNPYVGGLAASFKDEQGFTWDFAVHVAHSHYHYVDRLMDDLLPDGFFHHERRSWVREYDTYIPYPFQNNIRHLPPAFVQECIEGIREVQTRATDAKPRNFEEWVHAVFGAGIARHFMIPYNRKIWSIDPREMGYQWIGDRVPTVDLGRILRNIEQGRDDVAWGPNHTFQFPKKGGTGAIWRKLADRIAPERIKLGTSLVALDVANRLARFDDGTTEHFAHLISTIPLIRLAEMTGKAPLIQRARQLRYTHVQVVGVAPSTPIPDSLRDKTWIYTPEEKAPFYRVTPFSIFSPDHVPDPSKQCSFLCEISYPGTDRAERRDMTAATLKGLRDIGLVDCDPSTTHIHNMWAEFGYPVPTTDRDAILNDVLPELETMRLYSRGRFGGWKYEVANMDHSLMQGVEVVDRILDGATEVTLPTPNIVNAGKR